MKENFPWAKDPQKLDLSPVHVREERKVTETMIYVGTLLNST